jgi:hypothetical protein
LPRCSTPASAWSASTPPPPTAGVDGEVGGIAGRASGVRGHRATGEGCTSHNSPSWPAPDGTRGRRADCPVSARRPARWRWPRSAPCSRPSHRRVAVGDQLRHRRPSRECPRGARGPAVCAPLLFILSARKTIRRAYVAPTTAPSPSRPARHRGCCRRTSPGPGSPPPGRRHRVSRPHPLGALPRRRPAVTPAAVRTRGRRTTVTPPRPTRLARDGARRIVEGEVSRSAASAITSPVRALDTDPTSKRVSGPHRQCAVGPRLTPASQAQRVRPETGRRAEPSSHASPEPSPGSTQLPAPREGRPARRRPPGSRAAGSS